MIVFSNRKKPVQLTSFHIQSSMNGLMSPIFKTYYFRVKPGSGNYARTTLIENFFCSKFSFISTVLSKVAFCFICNDLFYLEMNLRFSILG